MTPKLRPKDAMMKANSPIWVSEKPHCMEVLSDWPLSRKPAVPKTHCPTTMASTMARMGQA